MEDILNGYMIELFAFTKTLSMCKYAIQHIVGGKS